MLITLATIAALSFSLILGISLGYPGLALAALIAMITGAALHQIGRPYTSITPGADHWTRRPTHVNAVWAERITSPIAIVIVVAVIFAGLFGVNTLLH